MTQRVALGCATSSTASAAVVAGIPTATSCGSISSASSPASSIASGQRTGPLQHLEAVAARRLEPVLVLAAGGPLGSRERWRRATSGSIRRTA